MCGVRTNPLRAILNILVDSSITIKNQCFDQGYAHQAQGRPYQNPDPAASFPL